MRNIGIWGRLRGLADRRRSWLIAAIATGGVALVAVLLVSASPKHHSPRIAKAAARVASRRSSSREIALVSHPKALKARRVHQSHPAGVRSRHVAASAVRGRELVSLRTRFSQTFTASGDKRVARVYAAPVNYRDAQGRWAPIDDSLVARHGVVVNRADAYQLAIPDRLGSTPLRISEGSSAITLSLDGARGTGSVSGSTDQFTDALPGVSVDYRSVQGALKDTLVLAGPSSQTRFVYDLGMPAGLAPRANPDGGIDIVDGAGRVRFALAAPFMLDQAAQANDVGHVTMGLQQAGSAWRVVVSADRRWLSAPGRRWPVSIDPTVSVGPSPECRVLSSAPTTSFCGAASDVVKGGTNATLSHVLLNFSTSGVLPADSQVLSATIGMYLNSWNNSTTVPLSVYGLSRGYTSAATWNTYDGTHAWSTPGGDYNATALDSANVPAAAGWSYWRPSGLVQGWVDGTQTNYGVIIKEPSDNVTNELTFAGVASSTNQPYIQIAYRPRVGAPSAATITQQTLNDRMSLGVNVANGNLLVEANDLNIAGTGINQTVSRTYNNLLTTAQNSGNGWFAGPSPDEHLEFVADGSVTYYAADGQAFPFYTDHNSGYVVPPGIDATLVLNSNGSYTITVHDGTKINFDQNGNLTSEVDQNGNTITYAGVTGSSETITDTQGRATTVTFAPTTHFITQVTDSTGRTVSYAYNTAGNMTSYTDAAGNVTSYGYDSNNNLTQITDPNTNVTKLAYDPSRRITSLTSVTNPSAGTGPTTTYVYYASSSAPVSCGTPPAGTVAYGETLATDPNGNQTAYCYDTHDRVFATIDAAGNRTSTTYNGDDIATATTQPNGATSTTTVDSCDRKTKTQAPITVTGDTPVTTSLSYPTQCTTPASFEPTTTTDSQSNATTITYDAHGNPTTITDPLSAAGPWQNTTQDQLALTYSSSHPGWLTQSTDTDGHSTSYGYDSLGNLTSITPPGPLGAESFAYDALSRQTGSTDGNGQTTTTTYDPLDRVTRTTYADGTTVTDSYDANGNLTSEADASGTKQDTYNALDQLTQTTLPGGQTVSYAYDSVGNLTSLTDAGGTVSYTYNNLNQLTKLTEPGGYTTTFTYDVDGNRTGVAYPNGVTASYTYDPADRPLAMLATSPSGTTITSQTYKYTDSSQDTNLLQSATDQSGNVTAYTYDPLHRLTSAKTTASGGSTVSEYHYTYDGAGNRLTQTLNGTTTTYTYNAANELTAVNSATLSYDADGNETSNGTTALTYNPRNQTLAIGANPMAFFGSDQTTQTTSGGASLQDTSLGLGSITTGTGSDYVTRDSNGNAVGERTPAGRYYYISDPRGTVLVVTDSSGNTVRTNTYDPYGTGLSSTGAGPDDLGYLGAYASQPSGLDHFAARLLDSSTGRWTQPDPLSRTRTLALLGDPTQINIYDYAGDDPINAVDLSGEFNINYITKNNQKFLAGLITILIALKMDGDEVTPVNPQNRNPTTSQKKNYKNCVTWSSFGSTGGGCGSPSRPPLVWLI